MAELKVRQVGNSLGATLPKNVLAHLKVGEGDTLKLIETGEGYLVVRPDTKFARVMEAAERAMQRNAEAYSDLAK